MAQHLGIRPLHRLALKIVAGQRFGKKIPEQALNRIYFSLKDCKEDSLLTAADFLIQVIKYVFFPPKYSFSRYLMQPDMEKEKDLHLFTLDTAAELLQTKLPDVLKKLRNIELSCIKDFAMILVEKYEEKEYLFTGSVAQFNEPLPDDAKDILALLEDSIKTEEAAYWVTILQSIIELLSSAQSRNMLQTALNHRKNTMRIIFSDQIKALSYNMPIKDLERVLPESIRADHYTAYMRTIHRICGALMINSHKTKKNKVKSEVYSEKVPKEVEFAQVIRVSIYGK